MEERGTPINTCPTISKNPLDLYKLYILTKEKGGYLEVSIIVEFIFNKFVNITASVQKLDLSGIHTVFDKPRPFYIQ